ncbi:MAG: right-handed parallel beta-helix repeat-containing protein [Thermoplasmata archaeon]|nr:MAG: right-handed parallel beta-helix repeat-containing protein [Thermoplasmata archaeon]
MKKFVNIIVIFILIASIFSISIPTPGRAEQSFAGPTYVSGFLNNSQTWIKDNSPYVVKDNLTIGTTGVLHIQPGVDVKIDPDERIKVEGKLYSNGTALEPIEFTKNSPQFMNWDCLEILSDGNSLIHTNFSNYEYGVNITGSAINPVKNNIIESCYFYDFNNDGLHLYYADANFIGNCTVDYGYISLHMKNSKSNIIYNNTFYWPWNYCLQLLDSNSNKFYNNTYQASDGATLVYFNGSSYNNIESDFIECKQGEIGPYYGLYMSEHSNFNTFYDLNITNQEWDSFDNYIQSSHNNTFYRLEIYSTTNGMKFRNATDIRIIESKIYTDKMGDFDSIQLYTGSRIYMVNTTFINKSGDLVFYDRDSTLWIQYALTVKVKDKVSGNPIQGATVSVKDRFGTSVGTYATDSAGETIPITTTYYRGRDSNGNMYDGDTGERKFFSPHNVTVSKIYYHTNYTEPSPHMDKSRMITTDIKEISIDSIKIQDAPGQGGGIVDGNSYGMGSTHTFYCSGYNSQLGYIKEVPAAWSSNNENIATVTSPGTQTTFKTSGVNSGTVRVSASYSSKNTFADVDVIPATIDYIRVQDSPTLPNSWVSNKEYPLNGSDTFYCVGYNNSIGLVGTVPASWISSNTQVGTVTLSGESTTFQASKNNSGNTYVEATSSGFTNKTGTLKVLPPSIDSLIIRTAPNGSGDYVGPRQYTKGDQDVFYCAGYNKTVGYVEDVSVKWESTDTSIGTVTADGVFTRFEAKDTGTVRVFASYNKYKNFTGTFTILPPGAGSIDLESSLDLGPRDQMLVGTQVMTSFKINNLGDGLVEGIPVKFEIEHPDGKGKQLITDQAIPAIPGKGHFDYLYEFQPTALGVYKFSIIADPQDTIVETDETNNDAVDTLEVLSLEDWTVSIEVTPDSVVMTADEEKIFTAVGIGKADDQNTINPMWSVNGGGTINTEGKFSANVVGTWEVYADFGEQRGVAKVDVTPGALVGIKLSPPEIIMAVDNEIEFNLIGFDSDGNEFNLPQIDAQWEVNGTIGTVDKGKFNATSEGKGTVIATMMKDDLQLSAVAYITVKLVIIIEKKYNFTSEKVTLNIKVGFIDDGSATIEGLDEENLTEELPEESFGDTFEHIGIFIKIEIPEDIEWDWLYLEFEYDPALLPEDFDENDLELFYFDEKTQQWVKCTETGVDKDRHVVYANVTHLTIFAPMAESSEAASSEPEEEETGESAGIGVNMMVILALVAVVFIIALAAGMIVLRKRREMGTEGESVQADEDERLVEEELIEEEIREREEDLTDIEIDLSELDIISTKCPSCKTSIEMEPTFEPKVHLECPSCNKKGKLPNPYLKEIEKLKETHRHAALRELEKEQPEPAKINCPKCKEKVVVPYDNKEPKMQVSCEECGASGVIKNPYFKGDIKERDEDRRKPKPPKRRKDRDRKLEVEPERPIKEKEPSKKEKEPPKKSRIDEDDDNIVFSDDELIEFDDDEDEDLDFM